jgi:hypothetical protein
MQESLKEILSLKYIWISLSEFALKDDKITKAEYILIQSFADKIEKYKTLLDLALEDGFIDGNERYNLFQAKCNILIETLKQARVDNLVTKDEFELLEKIKEFLEIIEKLEIDY